MKHSSLMGEAVAACFWCCLLSIRVRRVWEEEEFSGGDFGDFAASVVSGGGMDGRVTGEFLDCRDISAGGEEVADEGSAEVVRAAGKDAGFGCSAL
jgi:hypothetical protein